MPNYLNKKLLLLFLLPLVLSSCTQKVPQNESSNSSETSSENISSDNESSEIESSEIDSSEIESSENSSSSGSDVEFVLYDQTSYSGTNPYIYNYKGNYYSGISSSLTGNDLLVALDDLLDSTARNTSFTYKNLFTYFVYTDSYYYEMKSSTNSTNYFGNGVMTSFYSGRSAERDDMNREHVWPKSRGGSAVESDPHMTRPTITSENSARGNDFFNESPTSWDPASFDNEKYRGIAARVIMYSAVKGQDDGLNLVDLTTQSTAKKSMGKLSTLLKWNIDYPVDDSELLRNNYLADVLKWCRNPFIDDRNYACKIWGNTNSTTRALCGIH